MAEQKTGSDSFGGAWEADDCHAMVEGHGLEFLFFEVSATLGRKK